MSDVHVLLLGEVQLVVDGTQVPLRSRQERALLAVLAVRAPRSVSVGELVDVLWPGEPPAHPRKVVQTYISRLRRTLPEEALVSTEDGYALKLAGEASDAAEMARDLQDARSASQHGDHIAALDLLRRCLERWRGDPIPEIEESALVLPEVTQLLERRLTIEEELVDVLLMAGRTTEAVERAATLVNEEPLRERRWAQLMLALYRSGRQAEALQAFQRCRSTLVEELGIDPGEDLRELERQILNQDPMLRGDEPASPPSPAAAYPGALAEAGLTPFVGREPHLLELGRMWDDATSGRRQVVVLSGEPGIGKTRLAAAFAERARADGAVVLYGRCVPELDVPFQPFAEALAATPFAHSSPRGLLDPAVGQFELFESAVQALRTLASEAPVVLVIEDAHWATSPTLRMLRYVASSPDLERCLIIVTVRSTEGERALASLAELRNARRLLVGPLTFEDTSELVQGSDARGPAAAAELHRAAGGNPLFLQQLLLDASEPSEAGVVHARVGDVVMSRLARLRPATRAVLELAALVGVDFDVDVLVDAHAEGGQAPVLDALEDAEAAGLIVPVGDASGRFTFAHAVMREVLVEGLPVSRQLRLHHDIALALEPRAERSDVVTALARHCAKAVSLGMAERAVNYGMRAALAARATFAFEEAADLFALALAALDRTGAPDRGVRCDLLIGRGEALRQTGDPVGPTTLMEAAALARALGDAERLGQVAFALTRLGRPSVGGANPEILRIAEESLELAAADQLALRARVLALWGAEVTYDDNPRRFDACNEALALAREVGEPALLGSVLVCWMIACMTPRNVDERTAAAAELAAIAEQLDDDELRFRGYETGALAAIELLEIERYRELCDAAFELSARTGTFRHEAAYIAAAGSLLEGDLAEAERHARAARELGLRLGAPEATIRMAHLAVEFGIGWETGGLGELVPQLELAAAAFPGRGMDAMLAMALSESGSAQEATALLDAMVASRFASFPSNNLQLMIASCAAEAAANVRHRDAASALFEILSPLTGRLATIQPVRTMTVDRMLGRLAHVLGRHGDATTLLERAVVQEQRIGAPLWQARSHLALAALALDAGRPGEAQAAAEQAVALAAPRGATRIVDAAASLAARAGA